MNNFDVIDWENIDYQQGLQRQLLLLEEVAQNKRKSTIVFCSHPPTVTLGKNGNQSDIKGWDGAVIRVSRGGSATYHGPSQLIVYPIINLKELSCDPNILLFIRSLEDSLIETLKIHYKILAEGNHSSKDGDGKTTGVWIKGRKLASVGIAVKKWVSYHGMAINLYRDSLAFTGINPCGYQPQIMISLEEIISEKISREQFKQYYQKILIQTLLSSSLSSSSSLRGGTSP